MTNMKRHYLRSTLVLIMSVLMVISILPINVLAEGEENATLADSNATTDFRLKTDESKGEKYYEDGKTKREYYQKPNWEEEASKKEGLTKWELHPDQKLRKVNNMSEAYEIGQLNYNGHHLAEENGVNYLVLDFLYSWAQRSASSVWKNVNIFISKELEKSVDWTRSGYYYNYGTSKQQYYKFENGKVANEKVMYLSQMVQATLAGNVQHTPIRLYLKNVTMSDLDKIDTAIQTRVTNSNNTQILTTQFGKGDNDNLHMDGYGAYTNATAVPKSNSINARAKNNPLLRQYKSPGVDYTSDFLASQNFSSYNSDEDKLYVATKWRKGTTNSTNHTLNGNTLAYRFAFSKELLDTLEEDEKGFIGYIQPSKTSGANSAKNPTDSITGFTRKDVNIDKETGQAYIIFAPQQFVTNVPDEKVVTVKNGTNGFADAETSLLIGQRYTVTTFNVDSLKLKSLYNTVGTNKGSREMISLDIYTTIIAANPNGNEHVETKTTQKVSAKKGDEVKIKFEASPWAKTEKGGSDWIGMRIGDYPIFGDVSVYRSGSTSGRYSGFELNGKPYDIYTYKLPENVTFEEDSLVQLYANDSGNLSENSAEIFINGKKVASFNRGEAKTTFKPRTVLGTQSSSSTLLDNTQYRPAIKDMYDTDSEVKGYTIIKDQIVEVKYRDAETKTRKTSKTLSSKTNTAGASYSYDNKYYPDERGLYEYKAEVESTTKLVKDAPIVARTYSYQSSDAEKSSAVIEDAIKSALGSEAVIAKVLSKVTFDLNGGKFNDTVNDQIKSLVQRDAANSPVIRVLPMNKKFATDKGYKANGFEGENILLEDYTGAELKGDDLALRKYFGHGDDDKKDETPINPEKKGAAFLGWTTQPLTGTPEQVSEAFEKLTVATTVDQTNSVDPTSTPEEPKVKNYIFNEKSPVTESIRVYAAYGVPKIKFHTNPPAGLQDAEGKDLEDKVIEQAITDQNKIDKEVELNRNHGTPDFTMEGYSLVGYSKNPEATQPDKNHTGTGFEEDLYLRDGDKIELTDEIANNGLDLYAVWKKNYHVDITKVWDDAELKTKNEGKVYIGLLKRPAVGVQGQEVVHPDAVYRPVLQSYKKLSEVTETDSNGNKVVRWTNLPSYDENGHRISYIAIELTESMFQQYNNESDPKNKEKPKYGDYGIEVTEPHLAEDGVTMIWGHKAQLLNTDGVDAMTSATTRKHYRMVKNGDTETEELQNPHTADPKFGYFDTTGYSIILTNKKVTVQPPAIEDVIDGETSVVVKKNGDPSHLVVTLPDNTVVTLVKDEDTGKLKKDPASTFTGTVDIAKDNSKVTITLPEGKTFVEGQKIKAVQKKVIGEAEETSEEVTKTVGPKPNSNKVEKIAQKPYDKETGNVPLEFQVPNPPVNTPPKDTEYELGTVDEEGNFTSIEGVDKITLEEGIISDKTSPVFKTFDIPADKINNVKDKDLVIRSKEPGKKEVVSDPFKLDLAAPTATARAEDERWRRWVDIELSDFVEDQKTISITYTDINGDEINETFDNKADAEYTLNVLRGQGVENVKITLKDRFGNEDDVKPQYKASKVIQIDIREPRLNKDFLQVRALEDATEVIVKIYASTEDPEAIKAGTAKPTHTATATLNADGNFHKIKFEDGYKLKKGDYIEVIGKKDTENAYTNPYIRILGD